MKNKTYLTWWLDDELIETEYDEKRFKTARKAIEFGNKHWADVERGIVGNTENLKFQVEEED